jgi:hypothetical protein
MSLSLIYSGFPKRAIASLYKSWTKAVKQTMQMCFAILHLVSSPFCSNYLWGLWGKSIAIIFEKHMVNHQVLSESWHLLFYFALSTQIINDGPDTPSRIIFNSYYSSCYPFPISSTPSPNPANTLPNSDFSQSLIPPEFIMQHFKRMQR